MNVKKSLRTHNLLLAVLMLLGTVFMTSCEKDDIDLGDLLKDDNSWKGVQLKGANEVPAVDSDGYGLLNAHYNSKTKMLKYDFVWTLGNPSDTTVAMHFHGPATPTMSAGVKRPVTGFAANSSGGSHSGAVGPLSDDEEKQLLNGLWYFNIHSKTHPSGELRGNLLKK
ncbi:CHRD domain-containing protein [Pontibacter sp. E15-1]|uniref:CHRD domain-containing protein n=1 Tax=Pontibacter sp. E15-1 TaxID=2919918 RepID=UPI001F4FC40F|nr:CHRD domain-containing protein [Pontibacter sp. E15-1]MCJ8164703.1 CHRD domain-containing protein [Pontibacter sp. E15-1]